MVIEITPRVDCKVCHGRGLVDMGSVPYGSTWVSMGDDYCDCVIEQLPEDDEDSEIQLQFAPELLATWEAQAKAEAEAERRIEEAAAEYWASYELPQSELCPHKARRIDCVYCDRMEDMAFDAARERRMFR